MRPREKMATRDAQFWGSSLRILLFRVVYEELSIAKKKKGLVGLGFSLFFFVCFSFVRGEWDIL